VWEEEVEEKRRAERKGRDEGEVPRR